MISLASVPTLISEDSVLVGDLVFESAAHVHGTIEGSIDQRSLDLLQIGKSGWVHGNISSRGAITIAGRVDGTVRSHTRVILTATATVLGQIEAPQVQVLPGALIEAEVQMSASLQALELPKAA